MSSVNKVILLGRLTKDPDVRYLTDGKAVANLSIATSESWKDKTGVKQEKSEFHNCVAFGKLAEVIDDYQKKGSQLYIEGKLTTEKWKTKDGQDRYTTKVIINEMVMIGGKPENILAGAQLATEHESNVQSTPKSSCAFDDFENDLPF